MRRAAEKINERDKISKKKRRPDQMNSIKDTNVLESEEVITSGLGKYENRKTIRERIFNKRRCRKRNRIESVSDLRNNDVQISGTFINKPNIAIGQTIIKKQKITNASSPIELNYENNSIDSEHHSDSDVQNIDESDNSLHSKSLANGLFMDVEYYMQCPVLPTRKASKAQKIGQYSLRISSYVAHTDPILSREKIDLFNTQFATLNDNQWVDGNVIDSSVAANIHKWYNVVFIPAKFTYYFIGYFCDNEKGKKFILYNIHQKINGRLLMPYLYKSHWYLLVADIEEKTLILLDPLECSGNQEYKRVHRAFTKFLDTCPNSIGELKNIKWKRVYDIDRPYQARSDSNNCGVYVLYYLKCIGEKMPFSTDLNIFEFRRSTAETPISLSEDMRMKCIMCTNDNDDDQVRCCTCRRWSHTQCVHDESFAKKTIAEWSQPGVIFKCILCQQSFRNWMIRQ